jgi:hypothetical protein
MIVTQALLNLRAGLTDDILSNLARFTMALQKVGKGDGVRAQASTLFDLFLIASCKPSHFAGEMGGSLSK